MSNIENPRPNEPGIELDVLSPGMEGRLGTSPAELELPGLSGETSTSIPPVLDVSLVPDTMPPTSGDIIEEEFTPDEVSWNPERTPEERAADRDARINGLYNLLVPKIKNKKLETGIPQPWLLASTIEKVVRATLEELYDLDIQ